MTKAHSSKPASHAGLRTTLIGIIVSALLALAKALGGIFGNSYALIADAIESGADVFTSTMLWLGIKWSGKPPDENHPYGHGKAEALVAMGIAIALTIAAGIIIRDSIYNILEPHKTPKAYTLVILIFVILTKELLYRYVLQTGKEINSGAVKADAFHHRSDAITSAAAFVGISIALIGGEGFEVADDFAALLAGGFIIYNAWSIARPAIGELLDEALEPEIQEKVFQIASNTTGVRLVEKCTSRKMGLGSHVDMHISVDKNITVEEGHAISHRVKDNIKEKIPSIIDIHIHIEPFPGSH